MEIRVSWTAGMDIFTFSGKYLTADGPEYLIVWRILQDAWDSWDVWVQVVE